jgi:phosphoribosylformylglycinamidine synthase
VESCLRRNIGARVSLPEHEDGTTPFVYLFSESAGRALVAVPRGRDKAFVALAAEHNVSCTPIGTTTEEPVLDIANQFAVELDELRAAHTATLRNLFGGAAGLAKLHGDPENAVHPQEPSVSLADAPAVADDEPAAPVEAQTSTLQAASADEIAQAVSPAVDTPDDDTREPGSEAPVVEPVPVVGADDTTVGTTFMSQAAHRSPDDDETPPVGPAVETPDVDDAEPTAKATAAVPGAVVDEPPAPAATFPPDNFPTADVQHSDIPSRKADPDTER